MATKKNKQSIGCGVVLLLLGLGLIAQKMGWFQLNAEWLVPGALVAAGLVMILDALR